MALAKTISTTVPRRLLAGLLQAGMPAGEIACEHNISADAVLDAATGPFEPLDVEDMELLRDDDHRHELWDGRLWRMSPTKKRHGRGTARIVGHLLRYLGANPIGGLYIAGVGFRVGPARRLICPDAAYVSTERDAPVGDDDFFPYAPDLAAEVLSPDNIWPKIRRKAQACLTSGGRLVWALNTRRRTVTVSRSDAEPELLREEDVLSGEDVLPGFAVRVAALF